MKLQNFKYIIISIIFVLASSAKAQMRALNTAATGMATQEQHVTTISNNIANVNTIGFKKSRAESQDLLYETINEAGSRSSFNTQYSVGLQIGSGSKVSAVRKEFTQGNPQITNNVYDLLIKGDGFFGVILPNNEIRYTRDGAFTADKNGNFVTKNGYRVFPGITFPANTTNVSISESGVVEAYIAGQVESVNLGVIPLFLFTNQVGLKALGGNLYTISQASGPAIQNVPGQNNAGTVMQGALEASNVNIMTEMTNLIRAQRAYEMNSKVMGVADQMLQTVNNIR